MEKVHCEKCGYIEKIPEICTAYDCSGCGRKTKLKTTASPAPSGQVLDLLKSVSLRSNIREAIDSLKRVVAKHESGEAELIPEAYADYVHDLKLIKKVLGY